MANMKFFNALDVPVEGAVDGTYYVKDGDRVSTYIVSGGKVIPSDVDLSGYAHITDLELKANHGYASNPKTLKEVEDNAKEDIQSLYSEMIDYSLILLTSKQSIIVEEGEINIVNLSNEISSTIIDVKEGELYHLNSRGGVRSLSFVILDIDNNILKESAPSTGYYDYILKIPEGGVKLIFNSYRTKAEGADYVFFNYGLYKVGSGYASKNYVDLNNIRNTKTLLKTNFTINSVIEDIGIIQSSTARFTNREKIGRDALMAEVENDYEFIVYGYSISGDFLGKILDYRSFAYLADLPIDIAEMRIQIRRKDLNDVTEQDIIDSGIKIYSDKSRFDVIEESLREALSDLIRRLFLIEGAFGNTNGKFQQSPSGTRMASKEFLDISNINKIEISGIANEYEGFVALYSEDNEDSWIKNTGYNKIFTEDDFETAKFARVSAKRVDGGEVGESELQDIQVKIHLKEIIPQTQEVYLKLDRGSISSGGYFPNLTNTTLWKDSEFYYNFRTSLYVNTTSEFRKLEFNNFDILDIYDISLFEYDKRFNLIRTSIIDYSNTELEYNTNYIKISGKRKDGERIGSLPLISIQYPFGDNIYTFNDSAFGETQKHLIEVDNYIGRDQLEEYDFNLPPEEQHPYNQIDREPYYTNMILRTPRNYDPKGEPTRVIYFAHSSATPLSTSFGYPEQVQYLLDEGYMLIDMFAWTNQYPDGTQYMGTPTNIACANAMYKFVSENYNIKRDGVFITGKSHGGLQCYGAEYVFSFPILAAGAMAASINFGFKNYGYSNGDRLAVVKDLCIPEDPTPILSESGSDYNAEAVQWFRRNAEYFHGYIPMYMGSIDFDPKEAFPEVSSYELPSALGAQDYTAISRVPTKSWLSPDEPSVRYPVIVARRNAVKKTGGIFEIRNMPVGSGDPHHTVDTAGPFVPSITTRLGVEHENVSIAYVEMVQWFRRWEI